MVGQDHRAVKRITRPTLGFKSFAAAHDTLVGIELMHTSGEVERWSRAGQQGLTRAEQFDALAA